jgi:hypothetical protein
MSPGFGTTPHSANVARDEDSTFSASGIGGTSTTIQTNREWLAALEDVYSLFSTTLKKIDSACIQQREPHTTCCRVPSTWQQGIVHTMVEGYVYWPRNQRSKIKTSSWYTDCTRNATLKPTSKENASAQNLGLLPMGIGGGSPVLFATSSFFFGGGGGGFFPLPP